MLLSRLVEPDGLPCHLSITLPRQRRGLAWLEKKRMNSSVRLPYAGITSENVAAEYGVPRQLQDIFAAASHRKAAAARESGRFKDEIVPVETIWKDPVSGEHQE